MVEDDLETRDLMQAMLERSRPPWRVATTDRLDAALDLLSRGRFDVVLLDLNLPDSTGLSTTERLSVRAPDMPVVVVTGAMQEDLHLLTVRLGAQDCLTKGSFDAATLSHTLRMAIERKRGDVARARLAAVAAASEDAILAVTLEGGILAWNPAAERLYDYALDEARGRSLMTIVAPERQEDLRSALTLVRRGQSIQAHDTTHLRRNGTPLQVSMSLAPIRNPSGEVEGVAIVVRDIGPRLQLVDRLAEAEARYRMLFERNPQPMWVFDVETLRFLAVNDAACERYGYSCDEFLGLSLADIRPPEDREALIAQMATSDQGLRSAGTWRHRKKDGTLIDVEIHSHALPFGDRPARLVIAQDVTDKRKVEERLRQQQKMEAIGRLAGGVAHDFNNLLGVITGYAEILRRGTPDARPEARRLDEILKAAERAAALTHQLLAFSKPKGAKPQVLDLNSAVAEMDRLLRRLIGEDVELVTELDPVPSSVRIDRGHLEQVLMNLAVNARDAMPGGGELRIATSYAELDPSSSATDPDLQPGRYAVLSVSDTGIGMDAATAARIFEPFFTTKEPGQGTGLGLATVYGIVRQSGGHIFVYSEPGRGTTFKVFLPSVAEAAERQGKPSASPAPGGTETILLVEDDPALRAIMGDMLEEAGYLTLAASSPEEAVEIARSTPIDLLLTDVIMPGMTGPALAQRVATLQPRAKVLYASGYSRESMAARGLSGLLAEGLIEKPFTSDTLLRAVRSRLEPM